MPKPLKTCTVIQFFKNCKPGGLYEVKEMKTVSLFTNIPHIIRHKDRFYELTKVDVLNDTVELTLIEPKAPIEKVTKLNTQDEGIQGVSKAE